MDSPRPRVSSLIHNLDGSSYARVFAPLDFLERQDRLQLLSRWDIFAADLVVFHRHWRRDSCELMRELQRRGIRCVVDVDDDVFHVQRENPAYKEYSDPKLRQEISDTLRQADLVTVSTHALLRSFRTITDRLAWVPNGLDFDSVWKLERVRNKERDPFVIGWAGSPSHAGDFAFLKGVFRKLIQRYQSRIRFRFFGILPPIVKDELKPDEYDFVPFCPVLHYPKQLQAMQFDLALAPLANNAFNRGKSNLKWLEFAALSTPLLASDIGPYVQIRQGVDGWKVPNTHRAWYTKICEIVDGPAEQRDRVGQEAHITARHMFSMPTMVQHLTEAYGSVPVPRQFLAPRPSADRQKRVTIIVPVFNAAPDVRRCLDAVLPELSSDVRLLVVDDASTDPELAAYLLRLGQEHEHVTTFRLRENKGFIGACNTGFELANGDDVILLNSDTIPSPGFAARLRRTAYSDETIGTATAATNNGTIATVPEVSDAGTVLARLDLPPVVVPTAVGHCMYIKREVLDAYGQFDPAFGLGYGEENDFSLRIRPRYHSVVAPSVYVWHKGQGSFSDAQKVRAGSNHSLLVKRYPSYPYEVHSEYHTTGMADVRRRLLEETADPRPRVLHVSHSYHQAAGTEKHIADLCTGLEKDFLSFVGHYDHNGSVVLSDRRQTLQCWPYHQVPWPLTPAQVPGFDRPWLEMVRQVQPNLIHFQHGIFHPLALLDLLLATQIPVIVSCHDSFFLCPDPHRRECPGVQECASCWPKKFAGYGNVTYQQARRQVFGRALRHARAVIAPSEYTAGQMRLAYPDLMVTVVPHGLSATASGTSAPDAGPLRAVLLGNFVPHKGIEVILRAFSELRNLRSDVELHLHGSWSGSTAKLPTGVTDHGPYKPDCLPDLSGYHLGIVPSQVPESFCYTLSELQAAWLPVAVSSVGALEHRIRDGETGWQVRDYADPSAWQSLLSKLADTRRQWLGMVRPRPQDFVSLADMLDVYRQLYLRHASPRTPKTIVLTGG